MHKAKKTTGNKGWGLQKLLCVPVSWDMSSYIDTKAFSSKQLLAKFTPLEEVTQAVTDLVVLSPSKKEDVPAGYRRLP